MSKYKIASVISYSSYHNAYIDKTIEEAKKVSAEVLVVAYDHFFDGTPDPEILDFHKVIKPDGVDGIIIPWHNDLQQPARYFHNQGRLEGYSQLLTDYDFVFFIDSDEILEGDKVKLWLDEVVEPGQDYKLAHFWYYRDTCYRSRTPEEGVVLVSRETLESKEMKWQGERERENYSTHWNYMASYKNKVLGHHYSWAGTKEMILRKVSSWGHNKDTDWKSMVEAEYSHPFDYTCPFKPYEFDKIDPYIGFTFDE